MLGSLMQHNDIDGVIVGADRIVKNGDTANKVRLALIPPSQKSMHLTPSALFPTLPSYSHLLSALRHVVL